MILNLKLTSLLIIRFKLAQTNFMIFFLQTFSLAMGGLLFIFLRSYFFYFFSHMIHPKSLLTLSDVLCYIVLQYILHVVVGFFLTK